MHILNASYTLAYLRFVFSNFSDIAIMYSHSVVKNMNVLHIWTASLTYGLWASAGLMGVMISR